MKIQLLIRQTYEIEADTPAQAQAQLREGLFPTDESLLAVIDEFGHDITKEWHENTTHLFIMDR